MGDYMGGYHPITDRPINQQTALFLLEGAIMTEDEILELAESKSATEMAGYIEDVKEGNPSKWLLKKLDELWQDKLEWSFR